MEKALASWVAIVLGSVLVVMVGCKNDSSSSTYGNNSNLGPPPPNTFVMSNMNFSPNSMTVPRGTTITWQNRDGIVHTSTSDSLGLWDTGNIAAGNSKATPFTTAGTFKFHCTYHRAMGMTGTITVQ